MITSGVSKESLKESKMISMKSQVNRLFEDAAPQRGQVCENPVTGGRWLVGDDPIAPQKHEAARALLAREWVALNGPPDAPPLPLSDGEREDLKCGLYGNMFAWFARSFEGLNYDLQEHPSFDDYARGVMAAAERGEFVTFHNFPPADIAQMRKRYPPRTLRGLGPGLCWKPPAVNGKKRLCRG